MNALLVLPIVAPLVGTALCLLAWRSVTAQRLVSVTAVAVALAGAVAVLAQVWDGTVVATQSGGWPAPLGITIVADPMSAVVLAVGLATIAAVLVFAIGQPGCDDDTPAFHPTYLVLTAGVSLAFLTGDLFNLFVAFELALAASYVLLTLGATRDQVRHGMTYVVINLVASTLFVAAIAFVYAATGTVNLADLAGRLTAVSPEVRTALSLTLVVVFGIKAAVFPLFFWLPDSYPTARAPVTAVFAGLLTKIGVYCLLRTQTLLFAPDGPSTLLLVLAGLTMVIGVLGAIAQGDMKRILSFHIVSQVGYMVLGLALFTVSGLAGAVFFLVHQVPVKASLFLVGGMVDHAAGSTSLRRVGGLIRRIPVAAVLFGLAALSLAGVPPLSGFVGKLALVEAGFDAGEWAIVAVSLAASLLTLYSMTKIWNGVFWGRPDEPTPALAAVARIDAGHPASASASSSALPNDVAPSGTTLVADHGAAPDGHHGAAPGRPAKLAVPPLMTGSTVALVAVTVAIALFAGPLYGLCERAAQGLVDPTAYVQAVMGR
ncbi:MAG: Na+/H+ antiporter subunit D [Acidimicrobiales bacterium]